MLSPKLFSRRFDPRGSWSRADMHYRPFQEILYKYADVKKFSWQFDYGYGLVFTWAIKNVSKNYVISSNNLIEYLSFDRNIDFLE